MDNIVGTYVYRNGGFYSGLIGRVVGQMADGAYVLEYKSGSRTIFYAENQITRLTALQLKKYKQAEASAKALRGRTKE